MAQYVFIFAVVLITVVFEAHVVNAAKAIN